MHNLSMSQALGLWSDLEAAYYGKSTYSGDGIEIYAYRLWRHSPSALRYMEQNQLGVERGRFDGYSGEAAHDLLNDASRSLRALIVEFEGKHPDARVLLHNGTMVPAADWLATNYFVHRIHLKVERKGT